MDDITRRAFIGTASVIVLAPVSEAAPPALPAGLPVDRRTLRAAADGIIPADGRMPSASSAGVVAYIGGLASRDPDFRQRFEKAIAALGSSLAGASGADQVGGLEALEKADPPSFATLRDVVYEAYYSNPKVWALIGYSFRKGTRRTAPPETFDPARIARVQLLPRLYRDVE
jgi:Gluconate 2-dehydrogenase subunit 3